ncbi:LysR substrate-binding domain-containing protein [Exilibacterium tricleocarpae]|uniref:LysR substrate-binding domain-containing protein n=1 Tax=Exilibacterium tricleocarpae TaxID=2591008 RepID=UPI0015D31323|nr:LysR substrate-binding domain-containing protein [Exilibacterium tricleocarpae]
MNYQCLSFRNTRTGRTYPWYVTEAGKTRSQLLNSYFEAVLRAAKAGMGVSQMPGYLAKKAIDAGELEEVLAAFRPPNTEFHALYLERRLLSPRIRVFIDFLVEYRFAKHVYVF